MLGIGTGVQGRVKQASLLIWTAPWTAATNFTRGVGRLMAVAMFLVPLAVFLAGCGKNSVPGVYEHKQDRRGYDRHGDTVVFGETRTLDFRGDGSFVWTYDPGKDSEGYSGGRREVTTGKWKMSGGKIVCYNGDGSVFSTLTLEGVDLISGETRYRKK